MKVETLPQLDEAIAFLQMEIAALRAGEKDAGLPGLAVAVAAGEAPLPEPQFAPLLALWTPAATSFASELAALVDQFEAARRREEEAARRKEDRDARTPPVHSALARVRSQRRRPRTRPRRRFEDPDEGEASQSASDGTPTPSPRADVPVVAEVKEEEMKIEQQKEEKTEEKKEEKEKDADGDEKMEVGKEKEKEKDADGDEKMEVGKENEKEKEQDDVVMEEITKEKEDTKEEDVTIENTEEDRKKEEDEKKRVEEKTVEVEKMEETKTDEKMEKIQGEKKDVQVEKKTTIKEKNNVEEKMENVEEKNPEKEEAEAALASLKALRKTMLLDVLSKIVSVAKSKDVNPAMFSKKSEEKQEETKEENEQHVDLEKIHQRVTGGAICEWAQFAEQVYIFCQHVVTDAEQREQPEARRKGVELLHFARTLTETLRKASVKKEATLLQKIREAEEEAAARKEEAAARKQEEEAAARKEAREKQNEDKEMEESTADEAEKQAADSDSRDSSSKATAEDSSVPLPLTPTRASSRIRKRTSLASDGTGSAAPSPSSKTPRKRTRGASASAASASEEVSGSESHEASASEADTKSRASKSPASKASSKRAAARRRRPSMPATRTSSRQQKRRAAALAAAAAVDSAASGDEEDHSGGETLHSAAEKDINDEEEETGEDEHEEGQQAPKKKRAAPKSSRSRKKGSRKSYAKRYQRDGGQHRGLVLRAAVRDALLPVGVLRLDAAEHAGLPEPAVAVPGLRPRVAALPALAPHHVLHVPRELQLPLPHAAHDPNQLLVPTGGGPVPGRRRPHGRLRLHAVLRSCNAVGGRLFHGHPVPGHLAHLHDRLRLESSQPDGTRRDLGLPLRRPVPAVGADRLHGAGGRQPDHGRLRCYRWPPLLLPARGAARHEGLEPAADPCRVCQPVPVAASGWWWCPDHRCARSRWSRRGSSGWRLRLGHRTAIGHRLSRRNTETATVVVEGHTVRRDGVIRETHDVAYVPRTKLTP